MIFTLFAKSRSLPTALALAAFACAAYAQADQPASRAVTTVEVEAVQTAPARGAAVAEQPAVVAEEATGSRRIDIGAATRSLLALQRKSMGTRARPIDGEQASRSYQRYLKSFETTIPEHYDTGLGVKKQ